MKPLLRWVIGPMSDPGIDLFRLSIKKIKKIYGCKFDYLICHNGEARIEELSDLNIDFFDQNNLRKSYQKYDVSWKLFPIRLRKNSHELVLDSDILIINKLNYIDDFLQSNYSLVYEGLHRNYGIYEKEIPKNLKLNSGLYGMPPGFDFKIDQKKFNQFDEQGLICSNLIKNKYFLIPLSIIPIVENRQKLDHQQIVRLYQSCSGIHFVGINGGYNRSPNKNFNKKFFHFLLK